MTVSSSVSESGPYAGAGQTGPFIIGFRFLDDAHLRVVKTDSAGIETLLTLSADYTAVGAGEPNGGSVTLLAPLAAGLTLTILRDVPITQETDYTQSDSFPAESHEGGLDKLTMIAQQHQQRVIQALRVPESAGVAPLPAASVRRGGLVGFDTTGAPVIVDQSVAPTRPIFTETHFATAGQTLFSLTNAYVRGVNTLAVYVDGLRALVGLDYEETSSQSVTFLEGMEDGQQVVFVVGTGVNTTVSDASVVAFLPAGAGAVATDVEAKLREVRSVTESGMNPDESADVTAAFQARVNASPNRTLRVPARTYILSTVNIPHDITFECEQGVVFKRKAGLDVRQSYLAAGTAMFENTADGLTVRFMGAPTFDGNRDNQPVVTINPGMAGATTEPSGWAFKYNPVNLAGTANNLFWFDRPLFRNGTTGYLFIRGADVNRTFRTQVILMAPRFTDTVRGYGKNDPATPTALGWSSDYIDLLDYVELVAFNLDMRWSQYPTPLGAYAPVGIRGTFYGADYNTSGAPLISLYGKTRLEGLGRKTDAYNNAADYTTNNGIGAVDAYGNGESIFCEDLQAIGCENVPLRAKGSIKRFTVLKAAMKDCRRGLQVSPSSTGAVEAVVQIGSVESEGGWNPQVEIVGSNAGDLVKAVHIGSMRLVGGTNGESIADNAIGAAYIRFCDAVHVGMANILTQDKSGLNVRDNVAVTFDCLNINGTGKEGALFQSNLKTINVKSGTVKNTTLSGVSIQGATENVNVTVTTDTTMDYGVFVNNTGTNNNVSGTRVANVAGLSRGYYFSTQGVITGCSVGAGVTTPLHMGAGAVVEQRGNSFTPKEVWGTAAPVAGTWARGDRVRNSAPAAGGIAAWICTTAGTPGTWKAEAALAP